MTPEQLAVAQKYLDSYTRDVLKYKKPNMKFVKVCGRAGAVVCV